MTERLNELSEKRKELVDSINELKGIQSTLDEPLAKLNSDGFTALMVFGVLGVLNSLMGLIILYAEILKNISPSGWFIKAIILLVMAGIGFLAALIVSKLRDGFVNKHLKKAASLLSLDQVNSIYRLIALNMSNEKERLETLDFLLSLKASKGVEGVDLGNERNGMYLEMAKNGEEVVISLSLFESIFVSNMDYMISRLSSKINSIDEEVAELNKANCAEKFFDK